MADSSRLPPAVGPEPAVQPPTPLVVEDPTREAAETAKAIEAERAASPLRGVPQLLLGSVVGKVGAALFLALVALSLWVVLTYPLDFVRSRWSNTVVWAENPQNAPPVWTARFVGGYAEHTVATHAAPT